MELKPAFPLLSRLIIILFIIVLSPIGTKAQTTPVGKLQATSQGTLPSKHAKLRFQRGDVNQDGDRSLIDIMILVDAILNEELTFELKSGDMDDDGQISLIDITILVDIVLGGSYIDPDDPSFPIGGNEGGDPSGGL